jgi:signal peptidase
MVKEPTSLKHKILTVVGTVLCILLIPVLLINLTLIAKSFMEPEKVPSIGGTLPLIVLTDSMYPEIASGDLIICHTVEAEDVKVKDVIAFFDPAGNGSAVVTHRVIEVYEEDGVLYFRTQGDNNNTEDRLPVPEENLVGIYQMRIPGAGHIAMFMQSTPGLILCVVLPIVLFLLGIPRDPWKKQKLDE